MFAERPLSPDSLGRGLADRDNAWIPQKVVASLSLLPDELTRRLGLTFAASWDNLDALLLAVVDIDGHPVALIHYPKGSVPTTDVAIEARWNGVPGYLSSVLEALGVSEDEVMWRADQ